ncbi:MAG: hypothetical protein V4580_13785 [Bacteroidota bacterium]
MIFSYYKNTYNKIYLGFFLSIILVFFYTRPLNSDYHKFIAGDGFGYYSYLPAKYIFNDPNYDFKWFNKAHNANYVYSAFPDPEQNLLVQYGDKKINKYYQGLSFIWMPFFIIGHICAKLFHYPPDGFSQPYQWSIGLASLFYLFLGLFFLRRLIKKIFNDELIATITPIFIFYGTYLFYYGINLNSQSHVYSFTFITVFIYFAYCLCTDDANKLTNFFLSALCLTILICIRPLNGLIIFLIPAFLTKNTFKNAFNFRELTLFHLAIFLLIVAVLYHQLSIMYIQTGTFFPYTYTDEHFDFAHPRLFDTLISYHSGWFVYVPLALIAFFGAIYLPTTQQKIILPLFFAFIIFIYSCWWYWPITARAVIDFHALLAIFLASLLVKVKPRKKLNAAILIVLLISACYYQLKSFQQHNGILVENYTYKDIFWRNFFRIHKTQMFLVPPESILKRESYQQDMESGFSEGVKSLSEHHSPTNSILLDKQSAFCAFEELKYPKLFNEEGIKKIRLSFWCNFKKDITAAHIYLKLFDANKEEVFSTAFYINEDDMMKDTWDYKEFGYQIGEEDLAGKNPVKYLKWFIWNNEGKGELFVDDMKTEFILTNKHFETLK